MASTLQSKAQNFEIFACCELFNLSQILPYIKISVNQRKLYNIMHKQKNQLIFVTDKIEEGRKFVSQSEKRVSKSYKQ